MHLHRRRPGARREISGERDENDLHAHRAGIITAMSCASNVTAAARLAPRSRGKVV
jgi:hypothetical protein